MSNTTGGFCECGCGELAPIARYNDPKASTVKGQPQRFIPGHNMRSKFPPIIEADVPIKYCECGCGGITSIATENDASTGKVRGQRMRFLRHHHSQRSLEDAFLADAIPGGPDECWEWTGMLSGSAGYGSLSYRHRRLSAHRISYERVHGEIPKGLCVLHKCDNPKCWNPKHLFLGTHGDNVKDKVSKGRQLRGEKINFAKLNSLQVAEIKIAIASKTESLAAIARRYNVVPSAISNIRRGKTWKHVPYPTVPLGTLEQVEAEFVAIRDEAGGDLQKALEIIAEGREQEWPNT